MDQVEAYVFDVFGTCGDWRTSIERELKEFGERKGIQEQVDWPGFVDEWRDWYYHHTKKIAGGGEGTINTDEVHRQYLDQMLQSPKWSHLAHYFEENDRVYLTQAWHYIHGFPDVTPGLHALKKQRLLCALSNGHVRLLVDMARHSDFPFDVIFSTELFGTFKPNPAVYLSACKHLSLPPSKCAMIASHIFDLRGAAAVGMKTVYVPRVGEDKELEAKGEIIKTKEEGGEVDFVAKSFVEVAEYFERIKERS
ncbi:hypothetical protein AX16_006654 [Volvariella volvacea WC 439]|nr:hypothetical protein AX16_006654 [Volvariella volvacea WC 439]